MGKVFENGHGWSWTVKVVKDGQGHSRWSRVIKVVKDGRGLSVKDGQGGQG